MNEQLTSTLREAMRLMQTGDLMAATAEIQRRLGAPSAPPSPTAKTANPPPIEGAFRVIDSASDATPDAGVEGSHDEPDRLGGHAQFAEHVYAGAAGSRRYRLFVPSAYRGQPLPLVVMLHGCTQTPDDFATGTRMNVAAEERKCFVAYPAQSPKANISKCWNWFQSSDQNRDRGEPAIIAGLVRELSSTYGLDSERIYVAGMSAGGAMAVILGRTYPDLFAAVGVHSGLPYRAAHDLPSAFAAMQRSSGASSPSVAPEGEGTSPVPTIVFHGDRDTTVHPGNGDRVASDIIPTDAHGFSPEAGAATERRSGAAGGRDYTCTLARDRDDRVVVEHWLVHGAGHAWCGGDARGSFTDRTGPDASREMLRFFFEHPKKSPPPQ